ncbi:hypothetical protein JRQ81_002715 [Phrynocephalus forsythii]|uniref:Kazal-like domain-containing protein n=1 Tax=Phrynocephalus forsythii TaxID=171643 RepID=A0A9Q0XKN6_9SAUR|nr:hypothetical protein JRQ81_002715 [Phrynocephalus forsythii]
MVVPTGTRVKSANITYTNEKNLTSRINKKMTRWNRGWPIEFNGMIMLEALRGCDFMQSDRISAKEYQIPSNFQVDCGHYHLGKGGHVLCNRMYRPVCGTDDKTYPSECEMCRQILEFGVKVAKKHDQRCISDICQQYSSNRGTCTLEYSPHCGSDNKMYSNLCDFCNSALRSGGTLFLKHPGPCREE